MESMKELWDALATWLVMPATLLGGAGGMLGSLSKKKSLRRSLLETVSGAVVANVTFPLITMYCPASWHYTLFFISGVGGLKLVEAVVDAFSDSDFLRGVLKLLLERGRKEGK